VEEQAPIAHFVEPAEGPSEMPMFRVMDKPDLPRAWFLDVSGTRLIQIQRDRFLHNWRKTKPDDEYPHFPAVRETFFNYWESFTGFLAANNLQAQPDQCELTYVNLIRQGKGWETMADLEGVFPTFRWRTKTKFLPDPENVRWSLRFPLPVQQGRLHVEVLPVRVPPENDLAIRYSLTARGRPEGELSTEAMDVWFNLAREWIVRGFADLVDRSTDELWERRA